MRFKLHCLPLRLGDYGANYNDCRPISCSSHAESVEVDDLRIIYLLGFIRDVLRNFLAVTACSERSMRNRMWFDLIDWFCMGRSGACRLYILMLPARLIQSSRAGRPVYGRTCVPSPLRCIDCHADPCGSVTLSDGVYLHALVGTPAIML